MLKRIPSQFLFSIFIITVMVTGCAAIKDLTPGVVEEDIGGAAFLSQCQFFISKDVSLKYVRNTRENSIDGSGVVNVQRDTLRRTIRIASSTPGVLRTRDSKGNAVNGVRIQKNRSGDSLWIIQIWFDDTGSDDDYIEFSAFYDEDDDYFEFLVDGNGQITYPPLGGEKYTVEYEGSEPPYLRYELKEKQTETKERKRLKGRTVEGRYN